MKKIILIGDYKKGILNNPHNSQVLSRREVDYSLSLFERLIVKENFPALFLDRSFAKRITSELNTVNKISNREQLLSLLKDVDKNNWQRIYERSLFSETISGRGIEYLDLLSPLTLSIYCLNILAKIKLAEDRKILLSDITPIINFLNKEIRGPEYNELKGIVNYVSSILHYNPLDYNITTAAGNANAYLTLFDNNNIPNIKPFSSWSLEMKSIADIAKSQVTQENNLNNKVVLNASEEWEKIELSPEREKRYSILPSSSMKSLLRMVGIEKVKRSFLDEFYKISIAKEQKLQVESSTYNAYFIGNPGTGKSTVANIYGKFLIELGVLPESSEVHVTSGSALLSGGVSLLEKILEKIKNNRRGGVIFVDEAYQLMPQSDREGRKVTDFILTLSDKFRSPYGPLVWVLAGYNKQIEGLLQYNPGFQSRFPNKYVFDDYNDDELLSIFMNLLKSKSKPDNPFTTEKRKWFRIAMKRIGKSRNRDGFGNARDINTYFDLIMKRQAARITIARDNGQSVIDIMELTREDILGPIASFDILENSLAWKEILSLEGLEKVKEELRNLFDMVILNSQREEEEKPLFEVSLNRIFLGNPGTGKTTVANLYGKILTELGLLSKGEVIIKHPSDFVGDVVGGSEKTTRNILDIAIGNVLVIDEAYGLNPFANSLKGGGGGDSFKTSVIDTIVEQVKGVPGEDRAIVLVGYKEQMEQMISNCNPGFARRFQMENALVFEDYDDLALLRILRNMCKSSGLKIDIKTATYAISQLGRSKSQQNFGNAGSVSNLLSAAKLSMQKRLKNKSAKKRDELIMEDFSSGDLTTNDLNAFQGLVGCDQMIKKMEELRSTIEFCRKKGQDPNSFIEYNYIFSGPPGTGKVK